ncbi:MAG: ATP-binding protein [Vicinamibacterales bacterium]
MGVGGVQHLIERGYREGSELQYVRELFKNALEAGATRIEFGPEWQAVEREGVYRLMVADNGKGMGPDELLKFLNTFGGGGKPIGDAHENFGVGAKTSLLPWNHEGVVVISWVAGEPEGSMVWLRRDAKTGECGARRRQADNGFLGEVVRPFGDFSAVKSDWIHEHGTVVICFGNAGTEDTFLGEKTDQRHADTVPPTIKLPS